LVLTERTDHLDAIRTALNVGQTSTWPSGDGLSHRGTA
jgi:hypothetical protein